MPEINTIRFSFSNKTLLFLTDAKVGWLKKVELELKRRKNIVNKLKNIHK